MAVRALVAGADTYCLPSAALCGGAHDAVAAAALDSRIDGVLDLGEEELVQRRVNP